MKTERKLRHRNLWILMGLMILILGLGAWPNKFSVIYGEEDGMKLEPAPDLVETGEDEEEEMEETIAQEDADEGEVEDIPKSAFAEKIQKRELSETVKEADDSDLIENLKNETASGKGEADFSRPVEDTQLEISTGPSTDGPLPEPLAADIKNKIINARFNMRDNRSFILLDFEATPRFEESKSSQISQVVYTFSNTETANSIQRAYDTSEFISPVGLFTLLQMPNSSPPLSKLIVQMRENVRPSVKVLRNQLSIEFPPVSSGTTIAAETDPLGEIKTIEENIYSPDKKFTGNPIRLEIKNSDVQDVIRLIAKSSGYNVVIGEDVKGNVGTLSLQDVPWDQALTLVLQTKKLGYVRQGKVLRIGTLASLKAEKEAAIANEQSQIKVEPLRTVLVPISYAKATDLAPKAKSFLTERGVIETDARTNTIIVKDIDKVISRVQKLFLALDNPPQMISISAKFVEVSSQFRRDMGFSNVSARSSFSGLDIDAGVATNITGAFSANISARNLANLQMAFRLGELNNKIRELANPTVSAVANQQAQVSQTVSFFVPESAVVGGITVPTVRQVTTNLSLQVTPIVSGDGAIFMSVDIRNEIPSGSGADARINARNVQTQVLVENGDTAVIGGVFKSTMTDSIEGMPFLMKIPILGFLVSGQTENQNRSEVLVFLTPKILNAEESFKRTI